MVVPVVAVLAASSSGQAPPAQAAETGAEKLDSPKATMFTFLGAMDRVNRGYPDAWPRAFECLDLSAAPNADARQLASKLLDIFDRLG